MLQNKFTILIRKTLAVIIVGVFLLVPSLNEMNSLGFTSTLGWAQGEKPLLTGIGNNTSSFGVATQSNKLAPESRLNGEDFKYSLTVGAICKHVKHDGNLDDKLYLNDVLARLDVSKNPNITVLPYEIIIEIPNEGLAVRYFDPTKANVITSYSDISKLSTKVIGPRLNRQIIHRMKALPGSAETGKSSVPKIALPTGEGLTKDKIFVYSDEEHIKKKGDIKDLVPAYILQEIIKTFFLSHSYVNTKKLLNKLFGDAIGLSNILKISAREFQRGKYLRIYKTEVILKNNEKRIFILNVPILYGRANDLASGDFKNLYEYNRKYPGIVVQPIFYDSVKISNIECKPFNIFALEWLSDYVELNPLSNKFVLNPSGRLDDEVNGYQLKDTQENHSNVLSEVVKLLIQMAEYKSNTNKIEYINNVSLAAGDFMLRPLEGKIGLKLITIRSIERQKEVEDLLDILFGNSFAPIVGKNVFDIKAIGRGIWQGLTAKYGKREGVDIYRRWIKQYSGVLEKRKKNLSKLIKKKSVYNPQDNIDQRVAVWLRKNSGAEDISDTRFNKDEKEIIGHYLKGEKFTQSFEWFLQRQLKITEVVLKEIGSGGINKYGHTNKIEIFKPILSQVSCATIDRKLSQRVQSSQSRRPTSQQAEENEYEVKIAAEEEALALSAGVSKAAFSEFVVAEELIPNQLEMHAIFSGSDLYGKNRDSGKRSAEIITESLMTSFGAYNTQPDKQLEEKTVIEHLVDAINKANKIFIKDPNLRGKTTSVSVALMWHLPDGSRQIIMANQGNNQIYLKSDKTSEALSIKNFPDALADETKTMFGEKIVYIDWDKPLSLSCKEALGKQEQLSNYSIYDLSNDESRVLFEELRSQQCGDNTIDKNDIIPMIFKKTLPKDFVGQLIIASKGVDGVLTANEINEIGSAKDMAQRSYERSSAFFKIIPLGLFGSETGLLSGFLKKNQKEIAGALFSFDETDKKEERGAFRSIPEHLDGVLIDALSLGRLLLLDRWMSKLEETSFKIPQDILEKLRTLRSIINTPGVARANDEADISAMIVQIGSVPKTDLLHISAYIDRNEKLLKDILDKNKGNVLLRVLIEVIESIGIDNIKDFLATFQEASNGYVELYYMSGVGEASESVYHKYGLQKKPLPRDFKGTRENTVTLFPALKGEEIDKSAIVSRLGNLNVTPDNTILSPIGLQHDPAGLIRATILGLKMMDIARQIKEKGIDITKDQAFKDKIQLEILEQLKNVCDVKDLKNFNLTPDDIIALAVGNINNIITALKKLIRLLPITPINAEELRQIYEHAKEVITAA